MVGRPRAVLDFGRLGVHGDVEAAHGGAEEEGGDEQERHRLGEDRQRR